MDENVKEIALGMKDMAIQFHTFIDDDPKYYEFVKDFFKKDHLLPSVDDTFDYFIKNIYKQPENLK